jgi:hypothetical protein
MRAASLLALWLLVASVATARADCDGMKDLRLKVEHAQRINPSAQTAAAAKELKRYDDRAGSADEVDCYNTIARVERALKAPAPIDNQVKPGEAAGPINERAKSIEEQAKKE